MLPNDAVLEFRTIYLNKLGLELSVQEAQKKAENFIQLFDLVTRRNGYEKKKLHNSTK